MNDPKCPPKPHPIKLTIKNVSALVLVFWLKCPHPFAVDRLEFDLAPGESAETHVTFNANLKGDKQSAKLKTQMVVAYRDHPQKDKLNLFGEICYPNLAFEAESVDFGCILAETSKRIVKTITNNSQIDVDYHWIFSESEGVGGPVAVNVLFDILPMRGTLQPGQTEDIEFVFHGHSEGSKVKAMAVCEVEGGPSYQVPLHGEASSVVYALDTSEVDFGPRELETVEERELVLSNKSKVAFEYFVNTDSTKPVIEVFPMTGSLQVPLLLLLLLLLKSFRYFYHFHYYSFTNAAFTNPTFTNTTRLGRRPGLPCA
jgi:hydrocephalus-inducing protein